MQRCPIKKYRGKLAAAFALLLLPGLTALIPAPSLAHTVNTASWSVDLNAKAPPQGITCDLLKEAGKDGKPVLTVYFAANTLSGGREIPITVSCPGIPENTEIICTLSAESRGLPVSIPEEQKTFTLTAGKPEHTVKVQVTAPEAETAHPEAEVTLQCDGVTLKAIWAVSEAASDGSGTLAYCPDHFHPDYPFPFLTGSECRLYSNRPMVSYSFGGRSYLLYDSSCILTIPASTWVTADLSRLSNDSITLKAGTGVTMTPVGELSLPEEPIVVGAAGKALPIPYLWGGVQPQITVEHLERGADGLIWSSADGVVSAEKSADDENRLRLIPQNAPAGTYRVTVLWQQSFGDPQQSADLCRLTIPFFIQYSAADQGGV